MTEPAAPVDEAAVRAEIDALRDQPYGVGETQLDRAANTEALYKRLYPPSVSTAPDGDKDTSATHGRSSDAAPSGSAEEAKASIPGLRAELNQQIPGSPRYVELEQQLEGAYRTAYPEPDADGTGGAAATTQPSTSGEPLPVPPIPWELCGQYAYDHDALAELAPAVTTAGIPLDELRLWVEAGHGRMTMKIETDPATVDRVLEERFGDRLDGVIEDARSVLARLTPKTRASVERFLDTTGLSDSPAFVEWLAGHGRRLRMANA